MLRLRHRALAAVLVFGQLAATSAGAFEPTARCHCAPPEGDLTPCPCPLHRHAAPNPAASDDPPCPMHPHAAPAAPTRSDGPALCSGCAQQPDALTVVVWLNVLFSPRLQLAAPALPLSFPERTFPLEHRLPPPRRPPRTV